MGHPTALTSILGGNRFFSITPISKKTVRPTNSNKKTKDVEFWGLSSFLVEIFDTHIFLIRTMVLSEITLLSAVHRYIYFPIQPSQLR